MGGTDVEQVLGRQRHGEREHGQQQEDRLGRLQLPHLSQDLPLRLRRNPRVPQVASAGTLLEPHPHPALPAVEPDKQHRKRSPGVPLLRPSVEQSGIRIAISIFSLLFWMPGAFYIFITPYMIYMKEDATICVYYSISATAALWFFIWSIADFADANGWVMLSNNSD